MAASPIALVRSTVLGPLVEFLDQERLPYEGLFEAAKLSPRLIERPDDLIPLAQACALLEKITRATGLEDIGLLAASKIKIPAFGHYGDLACEAATLFEALHSLIAGINAFSTGERLSLEWRNERLFLCHKFAVRPAPGTRHADAYSVMVMIKSVQLALGSEWKPDLILLPANERIRKRQYEASFKTNVSFGSDAWAISIPPSRLADPIRKAERPASSSTPQPARSVPFTPDSDLIGSLRAMIGPSLRLSCPDIGHAAGLAGVSVSTLQRRLRESGITYSDLVETERLRLAIKLLAQEDIKICDVASELGYTEPGNFTRAFRSWTGLTPSTFRNHKADPRPARKPLEKTSFGV
jgi:AraC-like DNA-binding protein